ncbi:energy coupling factor transporter S component ThiW [Apilactobacillus quenuiae]|uniref:energy coupling factor transporter S component ThiW n=1 Tax=Apilactobacillus quenuiae TaxID=2008377 RepID=UPI000D01BFC8|nr:energy coupling factor transporter S component ThiW [Apilactobacillus quenuiae]
MHKEKYTVQRLVVLATMIALDFVLSPIFRIEGMTPISSVMNVIAAVLMGPTYTVIMAIACALMRMLFLGIPPLAFTGAVFGGLLAGIFYKYSQKTILAIVGEIIGTGLIGSLASYPIMVIYTGNSNQIFWFLFTPKFFGGAISGSIIAYLILIKLSKINSFKKANTYFSNNY